MSINKRKRPKSERVSFNQAHFRFYSNPEVKKAVMALEESAFTKAQLLEYEKFWDKYRTLQTTENTIRSIAGLFSTDFAYFSDKFRIFASNCKFSSTIE